MLVDHSALDSTDDFLTFDKQQPLFDRCAVFLGKANDNVDWNNAACVFLDEAVVTHDLRLFGEEADHPRFRTELRQSSRADAEQNKTRRGHHDWTPSDLIADIRPELWKTRAWQSDAFGDVLQQRRQAIQHGNQPDTAADGRVESEV